MTERVSIIVPAAASDPTLLPAALGSLQQHVPARLDVETIVVMNRHDPALVADVAERFPGVHVVEAALNTGVAGAGNRGRAEASGELLVVLHDDAAVEPGWLEALVELADERPDAGVIGGTVLHLDGRLQNAGMILWADGTTSPPWRGAAPDPGTFASVRAVDYCGTSSLMVRASLWDEVGGMDERFHPAYYVDVDLAMATRRVGMNVLFQPTSRIRHHAGSSTNVRYRHFLAGRNRLHFLEKWRADVAAHEPRSDDTDAIERAMARAEASAAERRGTPRRSALPPRLPHDPTGRRAEALGREVADEYARHLEAALDHQEAVATEARQVANTLRAVVEQARPLVACWPGVAMGFGTGGAAQLLPTVGGHAPEAWGRWLDDARFGIDLPLNDELREVAARGELVIELELMAFTGGQRTAGACSLRAGGHDLGTAIVGGVPEVLRLPVRPIDDATLRLEVTGHDPRTPRELLGSDDDRRLTVGLVSVRLDRLAAG